jgi:hypothetical protein
MVRARKPPLVDKRIQTTRVPICFDPTLGTPGTHILMEALMKMKEINATKADIIYVLRHTLDILERRGK